MTYNRNVSEIKRRVNKRKEAMLSLCRFLITKGISPSLAEEIISELTNDGKEIGGVKNLIAKRMRVTGDLSFEIPQKLALVGPTGVGKTTTLFKLAQYYKTLNKTVAITTLDTSKIESFKKLSSHYNILFAENLSESDTDLLLIDTEGCNYYQPNRVDELGQILGDTGEEIEVVLTLSAVAKEVDLIGAIHQFSPLCPSSLAFTKLDETLASGVLVNLCHKTDLPIRYIAHGYPLPGKVEVAHAELFTHKILTDLNDEAFQALRHLSLQS
ncbi:MAG: Flagellar biosynthesis protein FlhF [Chlamydiales bacterium]|nr:Flagellar biosynthesis protein FlhF [Chlamydiales bacterium]